MRSRRLRFALTRGTGIPAEIADGCGKGHGAVDIEKPADPGERRSDAIRRRGGRRWVADEWSMTPARVVRAALDGTREGQPTARYSAQRSPMSRLENLRHLYLRRVVSTAAGAMGPEWTAQSAQWLGVRAFGLNTFARRRGEERVRAALGAMGTDAAARAIVRGMYANWGRFWAEALFIHRRLRESSWRSCVRLSPEHESKLENLARSNRACLFAAGYFGNVAVLADTLGRFDRPIHVVVDYLAQPVLRKWQDELYRRPHVIPIERSRAASAVPEVLRRGGAVLLIAEQERRRGGIPCDYLGARLKVHPTLARLSRWFDAPIGVVSCRRGASGFSFDLSVRDVIDPRAAGGQSGRVVSRDELGASRDELGASVGHDPRDGSNDASVMRRILARLEAAALESPEQYLWSVPVGTLHSRAPSARPRAEAAPVVLRQELPRTRIEAARRRIIQAV